MGFVFDLLTAPALGPMGGVLWLARQLAEVAQAELLDEDRVRGQLLELQISLDTGEITEEEYAEREEALMERLNAIREAKAALGQG